MTINISIGERKFEYKTDFLLSGEGSESLKAKLNLRREGHGEGIWMFIHPEDKADYDRDVRDGDFKRLGILINAALCGMPWGAYVPYKLNGDERPSAIFEKVIDVNQDPQFHPEMWRRILEGASAQLIEAFNHCMDSKRPDYGKDWIEWAQSIHDDEKSQSHPELMAKIKETIDQCSTALNVQQKV